MRNPNVGFAAVAVPTELPGRTEVSLRGTKGSVRLIAESQRKSLEHTYRESAVREKDREGA